MQWPVGRVLDGSTGRQTGARGLLAIDLPRERPMATITKKELIDRIADETGAKRVLVKRIIQGFLDEIVKELGHGNRLEFRDFGVFECKVRAARTAQNPKTLERVAVPAKRTVKFKVGRLMKDQLVSAGGPPADALAAIRSPSTNDAPAGD